MICHPMQHINSKNLNENRTYCIPSETAFATSYTWTQPFTINIFCGVMKSSIRKAALRRGDHLFSNVVLAHFRGTWSRSSLPLHGPAFDMDWGLLCNQIYCQRITQYVWFKGPFMQLFSHLSQSRHCKTPLLPASALKWATHSQWSHSDQCLTCSKMW